MRPLHVHHDGGFAADRARPLIQSRPVRAYAWVCLGLVLGMAASAYAIVPQACRIAGVW